MSASANEIALYTTPLGAGVTGSRGAVAEPCGFIAEVFTRPGIVIDRGWRRTMPVLEYTERPLADISNLHST